MKQDLSLFHFSLFSGIGGLDLAAEWAGFETVGQCEYADYPTRVLEKHWPNVPRWRDIRDVTAESVRERGIGRIDVLSGGFPCQPFSVAGKQKGKEDDRYLWPEMLRVIRELTPRWVVGENVPGILRIAGRTVCEDLEREGYSVAVFNYEAAAVGAPHRRERVSFVANYTGRVCDDVAYSDEEWELQSQRFFKALREWPSDSSEDVADAVSPRLERWREELEQNPGRETKTDFGCDTSGHRGYASDTDDSTASRQREYRGEIHAGSEAKGFDICCGSGWWATEPDVGRVAHGIPSRVDRLRCLGNAVVPQWAYPIFRAIAEIERR